ncbi:MAG: TetR/AcrR family transcriptional regulator [Sarcina sp.]
MNDYIDPRIRRTQLLLENSFINLLETKSYSEISVKDIVETAHVNRSTFYLHYENKNDIFSKVSFRCLDELFDDAKKIPLKEDTLKQIQKKLAFKLFSTIHKNKNFFKALLLKESTNQYSKYIFQLICDFYEFKLNDLKVLDNYFPDSLSKDLFVNYISAAYLGVIKYWLSTDMSCSIEEISNRMIAMNNYGPIGGIQKFKKSKNTLKVF